MVFHQSIPPSPSPLPHLSLPPPAPPPNKKILVDLVADCNAYINESTSEHRAAPWTAMEGVSSPLLLNTSCCPSLFPPLLSSQIAQFKTQWQTLCATSSPCLASRPTSAPRWTRLAGRLPPPRPRAARPPPHPRPTTASSPPWSTSAHWCATRLASPRTRRSSKPVMISATRLVGSRVFQIHCLLHALIINSPPPPPIQPKWASA